MYPGLSIKTDTDFLFDNLYSLIIQIEQLHAERTGTEAARPELYSKNISKDETGEAVLNYLSIWKQIKGDYISPVFKIRVTVYDDKLV